MYVPYYVVIRCPKEVLTLPCSLEIFMPAGNRYLRSGFEWTLLDMHCASPGESDEHVAIAAMSQPVGGDTARGERCLEPPPHHNGGDRVLAEPARNRSRDPSAVFTCRAVRAAMCRRAGCPRTSLELDQCCVASRPHLDLARAPRRVQHTADIYQATWLLYSVVVLLGAISWSARPGVYRGHQLGRGTAILGSDRCCPGRRWG